jgi:hypothetical protein
MIGRCMKKLLTIAFCFLALALQALEYEKQFENDQVCVARAKLLPHEEVDLHRDVYPAVVIAVKGGVITRFEADGRITDVNFPTGVPVFREADPESELHKSVNRSDDPIELTIIQLKNNTTFSKTVDEKSHQIAVDIKISCPMSHGLKEFVKSIPPAERSSVNFDEWKASFVSSMTNLIRLVENEKIFSSYWSAKTDARLVEEVKGEFELFGNSE